MNLKLLFVVSFVGLALEAGLSQNFELELFNDQAEEGDMIYFNVSILNPKLSNVTVEIKFIGPNGDSLRFSQPREDRDRWLPPSFPPGTGTVNGSQEDVSLKRMRAETKFAWRTLFNGRVDNDNIFDRKEEGNWTLSVTLTAVDFERSALIEETEKREFNVTRLEAGSGGKFVIFILSALTSLFTTAASYFMVDQNKARALKKKVNDMQKEIMDAQRSGDKKRIAKAQQKQSQMMSLQGEMMRNQFKPMIIYMIPLFAVFYFLRAQYDLVPVVELPFRLSFMQFFHQNNPISPDQFGFIAWYFASATWFGSIFRKVIGVV
jgi:uncharacterized membrane protein (DUF106 family)